LDLEWSCLASLTCAVTVFLWTGSVRGAEIYRRLSAQYGDSAIPKRSVQEWTDMFRNGGKNMLKIIHLRVLYCWPVNINSYITVTFWLAYAIFQW